MKEKKEKKVGTIFIIVFFIIASFSSIQSAGSIKVNNIDESLKYHNNIHNCYLEDPWEVDDCFIYSLDISSNLGQLLSPITMGANFDYFKVKVIDTTEDLYVLSLSGKPVGELNLGLNDFIDLPIPIELEGKLKKSLFEATIIMEKAGYSVLSLDMNIKGKMSARLKPVPILFSIPFQLSCRLDFNPAFTLFSFIPEIDSEWDMGVLNFDVEGKIKLFFGLLSKSFSYDGATIPFFDQIVTQTCVGFEEITVDAGTFPAYVIEIIDGLITFYYSPELSNVIKVETHEDLENVRIVFELISLEESNMN